MNFLAHDVVLPSSAPAELRVAAAVPDLWVFIPKRPIPAAIRANPRASEDPLARTVIRGVDAHLRADATFHRLPEFLRRVDWLEAQMGALWPSLGNAELGAHLMVEMLLDRWLMCREPGLVENYYASFLPAHIQLVCTQVATEPESQQALVRVVETFASSRFLFDYTSPELLVSRFVRRLERVQFVSTADPPYQHLTTRIEDWSRALGDGSEGLIESVRQSISAVFA